MSERSVNPPPSLYFDYKVFPFRRPPEMDGARTVHPVVVVGGGPVGLELALELARHDVPSIVIEADATVSEGSRAICISRRSMEIFQQVGVIDRFLSKALPWITGRSYYRGQEVYRFDMPHSGDERFHPMANLQQNWIEQFLLETLEETGLGDVRWQSRVVGIMQATDYVRLAVETPEGTYELLARYVVAADGARSTMRRLMNLELRGTSYSGRYLIADIRLRSDYPTERRAWFDPPSNPGSTVLMHKQPDDIWRVDYQISEQADAETELREDNIRRRIQAQLDMAGETGEWELDWYSIYRAHCLCLDNYVQGRVIFAGDAAHLVPIFGVRGLNSGFADANNLGWKLAYVLKGAAPERLLESYNQERRAATLDIFREASKSTIFMTPPTRGYRIMRDAVLSLSLTQEFPRDLINPRQSAPYDYLDSPLNSGDEWEDEFLAGPPPGAPLRNMRLPDGQGFLLDHPGRSFTALYFMATGAVPPDLAAAFAEIEVAGESLTAIVVSRQGRAEAGDVRIADPEGRIFDAYGATDGSLYLVRPDGHVAARFRTASVTGLKRAGATALAREDAR